MFRSSLALFALVVACSNPPTPEPMPPQAKPTPEASAAPAPAAAPEVPAEKFGAAVTAQEPVALTTVLASPDTYANKTVVIDGVVRKTCTAKGCWMEVAPSADAKEQGCRVTFKNYGFFVPIDSTGSTARVEGVVTVSVVPKHEVAHLEGEGASFAKKFPDGSAREVRIVASGVELKNRKKS